MSPPSALTHDLSRHLSPSPKTPGGLMLSGSLVRRTGLSGREAPSKLMWAGRAARGPLRDHPVGAHGWAGKGTAEHSRLSLSLWSGKLCPRGAVLPETWSLGPYLLKLPPFAFLRDGMTLPIHPTIFFTEHLLHAVPSSEQSKKNSLPGGSFSVSRGRQTQPKDESSVNILSGEEQAGEGDGVRGAVADLMGSLRKPS